MTAPGSFGTSALYFCGCKETHNISVIIEMMLFEDTFLTRFEHKASLTEPGGSHMVMQWCRLLRRFLSFI